MISYDKSLKKCELFWEDCYKFWSREGLNPVEAKEKASEETLNLTHDPFTPSGDLLDEQAKIDVVKSHRD